MRLLTLPLVALLLAQTPERTSVEGSVGEKPDPLGFGPDALRTDQNGSFEFKELRPGDYTVSTGTDKTKATQIHLSERASENVKLVVANDK